MRHWILLIGFFLFGCNTQKRCARFVAKHPDCFVEIHTVKTDTITREMIVWDTLINATTDTIKLPTPCGDLIITKEPGGKIKATQRPTVTEIHTATTSVTQLPSPCDCIGQARTIKELKAKARRRIPWNLLIATCGGGFIIGIYIAHKLRP